MSLVRRSVIASAMENLSENNGDFERIVEMISWGYDFVLLRSQEKRPLHKGWQQHDYSVDELEQAHRQRHCNVGIKTGDKLIVLDVDSNDREKLKWVMNNVGETPMQVRTPSGVHCYFRTRKGVTYGNKVRIRGEPFDFRHNGGFVVAPPSRTKKGAYEWIGKVVPIEELPILKVSPLRERKRNKVIRLSSSTSDGIAHVADQVRKILHPEKYCLKIESIQGQNGSAALVRAVCILRDCGRSAEQALDFLLNEWNDRCATPPWSTEEIAYAIRRHYRLF